jgi:hypothetical protein
MTEKRIGEIFTIDGKTYVCIEANDDSCLECDLRHTDGTKCMMCLKCMKNQRTDHKEVIAVEINNIQKEQS